MRMSPVLTKYLVDAYRRDVLHQPIPVVAPQASADTIEEIKAEIARIDALKLGANLATRDFVSYQNRRALVALLEKLEIPGTFAVKETAPDTAHVTGTVSGVVGVLAGIEARDTANFHS